MLGTKVLSISGIKRSGVIGTMISQQTVSIYKVNNTDALNQLVVYAKFRLPVWAMYVIVGFVC